MPHPRHRLDVLLVFADPPDPGRVPHLPAGELLPAGFVDWGPVDFGEMRFVANHQGGFHVRCPVERAPIVNAFSRALSGWRAGGPRSMACHRCGADHDLAVLDYAPHAAFGRFVVEFRDVKSPATSEHGLAWVREHLGSFQIVLRRVG